MPHAELWQRHRQVMPSWMQLYYDEPIELVRGSGRRVTDGEGREYLDFFGGLLATMVGHDIPEITEAIRAQAGRLLHSSTLYLIRSQVELAERIAKLSGLPGAKVFFVNSGTEAVETALLLATQRRRSHQVLALRGSYHGRSFGTVAATGIRGWSATALSPLAVTYVHSGYRYRSPFGHLDDAAFVAACADELRTIIETSTAGDVACLLAEPVQGAGGFATPPEGFFPAMKAVLDDYGILLISDEVQSGWGRTGRSFFAMPGSGVTPDAITFAKGLGNGVAIGGVVAPAGLMDCLGANSISTAGGNPLATAAGVATLDYLLSHDLQANADKVGEHLMTGLRAIAESCPLVGEVRGMGLMIGVELVVPGTREPAVAATLRVLEAARQRGLLIGGGGLHGNVLRVTPPMTVTVAEADEALAVLREALTTVERTEENA
ncbi:aspartate aminotransferase family protein [Amycolatopsis sp. ATCC 39116]|uniref:aspartate aminotransferase family protein n=1 Tax=Amycolatopsis sp. (strain ATCC 39116 / 75iv2) TaxID=385957 RepID=UPI0002627CEC|nr:aspartate aminotransferase family protein [Amycolatopsis sp. ATCC 39116]